MLDNASDLVKSMRLSPIDEINKRNAVERDLFLIDLDSVIGTTNAKDNFAKMDEAFLKYTASKGKRIGFRGGNAGRACAPVRKRHTPIGKSRIRWMQQWMQQCQNEV